ncbi:dCMP deaminase family protein [symbiont of Argiope bruennichi]|uniref:deoxycytidylate deaminase n=1 Tax=symbiont of Argiope bruennichi TaxID=2810479 RepID=UPI003DA5ED55
MKIEFSDYFMLIAWICSLKSKDESTKVGACIISKDNILLATGYNGLCYGWDDKDFNWKEVDKNNYKYPFVVHAEQNCIANLNSFQKPYAIYVTHFPCNECAKLIIQKKIEKVFYLENKYENDSIYLWSKKLFFKANIETIKLSKKKLKDIIKNNLII